MTDTLNATEAADALEAQAKRIAELEAQRNELSVIRAHARVAIEQLEAQQYRCIRCMDWCSDNYCPDCGRGHADKVAQLEAQVKALEAERNKWKQYVKKTLNV